MASMLPRHVPRAWRLGHALLLAAALVATLPALAEARMPTVAEIMELNAAVSDPARAAEAIERSRRLLADELDPAYNLFVRQILMRTLILSKAAPGEILGSADTLILLTRADPRARVPLYWQVADALLQRGERLDAVVDYARRAVAECPADEEFRGILASCQALLGRALLERGEPQAAIAALASAVPAASDSHVVLFHLGRAYEQAGQPDPAIDAYVRSLGTFPGRDTSAAGPLRAAYVKRHGSAKGLEQRVAAARLASSKHVALDARRHDAPAPDWKLPDREGNTVQFADFKGKILVVDFWGSWCAPCRAELPHFQAVYERYKDRGVAFVGISWERESTREARLKVAKEFLDANGFSFPAVFDLDRTAAAAYGVQAFPTVYLIDRSGRIRYRNLGFDESIEQIMVAQIESLME